MTVADQEWKKNILSNLRKRLTKKSLFLDKEICIDDVLVSKLRHDTYELVYNVLDCVSYNILIKELDIIFDDYSKTHSSIMEEHGISNFSYIFLCDEENKEISAMQFDFEIHILRQTQKLAKLALAKFNDLVAKIDRI